MTTIKEFYKQFDDTEGKLVDMLCSPVGNISIFAGQGLKELYKIKRDLYFVFLSPNPNTPIELICPIYANIKKFVDEKYDNSSEKSLILKNKGKNLRLSDSREKDLSFFVEQRYVKNR